MKKMAAQSNTIDITEMVEGASSMADSNHNHLGRSCQEQCSGLTVDIVKSLSEEEREQKLKCLDKLYPSVKVNSKEFKEKLRSLNQTVERVSNLLSTMIKFSPYYYVKSRQIWKGIPLHDFDGKDGTMVVEELISDLRETAVQSFDDESKNLAKDLRVQLANLHRKWVVKVKFGSPLDTGVPCTCFYLMTLRRRMRTCELLLHVPCQLDPLFPELCVVESVVANMIPLCGELLDIAATVVPALLPSDQDIADSDEETVGEEAVVVEEIPANLNEDSPKPDNDWYEVFDIWYNNLQIDDEEQVLYEEEEEECVDDTIPNEDGKTGIGSEKDVEIEEIGKDFDANMNPKM